MGRVEAMCVSANKGERKRPVPQAEFRADHGIAGDAHAGPGHRQVSLLAAEDVESVRRAGLPDLSAGDFAENVVVAGLDLNAFGLGTRLRLGESAEVSITQIGKQCHSRCHIFHQTGDCIMPRLGLFARVTASGTVRVGDQVAPLCVVPRERFQAVVITVSDRCSRGEAQDTAGPAVAEMLAGPLAECGMRSAPERGMRNAECGTEEFRIPNSEFGRAEGFHVYRALIVPDEADRIADRLRHYCDGHSIDLVVTVGGTGLSPRDVTPEATAPLIERPTPGLDEAMRSASGATTPHAMLSRGVSGVRGSTLIVNLPGSKRAASENLAVILPALRHGLNKLRGDTSDCGRTGEATC